MKQYEPCIQNNNNNNNNKDKNESKKGGGHLFGERERASQGQIFIFIFSSFRFFLRFIEIGP